MSLTGLRTALDLPSITSAKKVLRIRFFRTNHLYCAFHKHANPKVQKPPSQLRFSLPSIIITITKHTRRVEIHQGGGGGVGSETEEGSQLFETAEKGGVVKNGLLKGRGSCKYVSVIMQRFTHRRKKKFFIL